MHPERVWDDVQGAEGRTGVMCRVPREGLCADLRIPEEGPEDLVGCQQKAGILRQQMRNQHLP